MADLEPMPSENQNIDPSDAEKAEKERKFKAKLRTVRIWMWVIGLLFLLTMGLSKCAMSKAQVKVEIIESCIKNVPFAEKWQQDLQANQLQDVDNKLISSYCVCMWDKPLEALSQQQINDFSSLNPQQQLDLLGGASAFEARDKQCVAELKNVK